MVVIPNFSSYNTTFVVDEQKGDLINMLSNKLTSVDELMLHATEIELAIIIALFLVSILKDDNCKCKCNPNTNSTATTNTITINSNDNEINDNKINDNNNRNPNTNTITINSNANKVKVW